MIDNLPLSKAPSFCSLGDLYHASLMAMTPLYPEAAVPNESQNPDRLYNAEGIYKSEGAGKSPKCYPDFAILKWQSSKRMWISDTPYCPEA
jgi:hypothetical protein